MKYYCVELDNCGFSDQTFDVEKYKDLICPNCYSPLLVYGLGDKPIWVEDKYFMEDTERSDER